jgi:cytochrome c biogenesis protein CcdA
MNLDTFEKIALVTSQKEAVTFQRFTSVFTFVSGFSALNVFVSLAVVVITGELHEETLWIIGINTAMIFGILFLFIVFRKPWIGFMEKIKKRGKGKKHEHKKGSS